MPSTLAAATACVAMFTAWQPGFQYATYVTDGTSAGTRKVTSISGGFYTSLNRNVLFSARQQSVGSELFITNGTTAGTQLVKDMNPGTLDGIPQAQFEPVGKSRMFARVGSRIVYGADNADKGFELWASNGTELGTTMIKEFYPGAFDGVRGVLSSTETFALVEAQNSAGKSLWVTNGTPGGTSMLMQTNDTANGLQASRFGTDKLLFTSNNGNELWVTNGLASGTRRIKAFTGCQPRDYRITNLKGFRDGPYAYFAGCATGQGYELWRTDGTPSGTVLVKNIAVDGQTVANSVPGDFYKAGKIVYFTAYSVANGRELWRTEGTPETTRIVKDIVPGPGSAEPVWFTRFGGRVVFAARTVVNGPLKLFVTNGTASGTIQIDNMAVFSAFANIGSKLVFGGSASPGRNIELWGTTGIAGSTQLIKSLMPGTESSEPQAFAPVVINNPGYFNSPASCPAQ